MEVAFIYPHQLFQPHPASAPGRLHVLSEDPLFFGDARYPVRFHRLKLAYQRAAMQRYAEALRQQGYAVCVLEYAEQRQPGDSIRLLHSMGVRAVIACDPVDNIAERRLRRFCAEYGVVLTLLESPNFLTTQAQIEDFFAARKRTDDYRQTDFYVWQRKRLGLLLDAKGKPLGGQWTYDSDNRHKLPTAQPIPPDPSNYAHPTIDEARLYVRQHFPNHPGALDAWPYPIDSAGAMKALDAFLEQRLTHYGRYQDAISPRGDVLFHSLLSAPLNVGLLSPQQVVARTLEHYEANPHTPLASVEGFLRQVVGWREFMRAVYVRIGTRQRRSNFWAAGRPLSEAWYSASLGMPPVDDAIRKVLRLAYAHHIERLMLLGNLMLLSDIHPDEVYRWFMELFIDAYDWVMVPNVYGMSQFADGGLITTKPYISSSNYVRKMSDYSSGDWCAIWDSLYWRFVARHADFFRSNPRLAVMMSHLDRLGEDGIAAHRARAEAWLNALA
ncbi:MAG: cryptochrome/photolyase family protein [Anaerolineae bacterium]|nr:cryptochrome/photolyase family protein [Anaerolineae bacterium]MDW8171708.1 cryptochrome/photolyase family protein [Anaerolineae bacterium]